MIDIKAIQHLPISEIIRTLGALPRGDVTGDLKQMAIALNLSVVPYKFDELKDDKPLCAFITNDEGRSCIFYRTDLAEGQQFRLDRIAIAKALVKYIITGSNGFLINESTYFSIREKQFIYELLMPESKVRDVCKQLIMPTVLSLANIFSVEPNFVVERLDAMKGKLRYMIAGYDF